MRDFLDFYISIIFVSILSNLFSSLQHSILFRLVHSTLSFFRSDCVHSIGTREFRSFSSIFPPFTILLNFDSKKIKKISKPQISSWIPFFFSPLNYLIDFFLDSQFLFEPDSISLHFPLDFTVEMPRFRWFDQFSLFSSQYFNIYCFLHFILAVFHRQFHFLSFRFDSSWGQNEE